MLILFHTAPQRSGRPLVSMMTSRRSCDSLCFPCLLDFDPLVIEKILSYLTPFEIISLELTHTSLRKTISGMWSYLLSTIPQVKYLTYLKYENLTSKDLTLISWKACEKKSSVFIQIGGLCAQHFYQTGNIFGFYDIPSNPQYERCLNMNIFNERRYPYCNQPIVAPAIVIDNYGRPLTFGGWYANDEEAISDCYVFHSSLGWKIFHLLNEPLCFASSSRMINGEILLCGGGDSIWRGSEVTTATELYRIPENIESIDSLTPLLAAPMLSPRCGHRTVTHYNGNVYAVGGYGGEREYYSSGEYYSADLNRWFAIPSMSERRSGPGLGMGIDGAIYCAGGSCDGSGSSDTIERYDPRCNQWTVLSGRMNEPRGYVSGSFNSQGNIFYVAGGITGDAILASIEWYDIRMNRWEYLVKAQEGASPVGYQRGDYSMMHFLPDILNKCSDITRDSRRR